MSDKEIIYLSSLLEYGDKHMLSLNRICVKNDCSNENIDINHWLRVNSPCNLPQGANICISVISQWAPSSEPRKGYWEVWSLNSCCSAANNYWSQLVYIVWMVTQHITKHGVYQHIYISEVHVERAKSSAEKYRYQIYLSDPDNFECINAAEEILRDLGFGWLMKFIVEDVTSGQSEAYRSTISHSVPKLHALMDHQKIYWKNMLWNRNEVCNQCGRHENMYNLDAAMMDTHPTKSPRKEPKTFILAKYNSTIYLKTLQQLEDKYNNVNSPICIMYDFHHTGDAHTWKQINKPTNIPLDIPSVYVSILRPPWRKAYVKEDTLKAYWEFTAHDRCCRNVDNYWTSLINKLWAPKPMRDQRLADNFAYIAEISVKRIHLSKYGDYSFRLLVDLPRDKQAIITTANAIRDVGYGNKLFYTNMPTKYLRYFQYKCTITREEIPKHVIYKNRVDAMSRELWKRRQMCKFCLRYEHV